MGFFTHIPRVLEVVDSQNQKNHFSALIGFRRFKFV